MYIKYDSVTHFVKAILNEPGLILLYIVKWFQVFLSNMNISIYYKSFVCIVSWFQVLVCNSNIKRINFHEKKNPFTENKTAL